MKLIFLHHLNYKYIFHTVIYDSLVLIYVITRGGGRSANLGGQTLIQDLLMKEVLLLDKGQTISKTNYVFFNSPKKRTKLTILSKEDSQDSEFCLFFGRIEKKIISFEIYVLFIPFLVFGHFWQQSHEDTKMICNLCLHSAREDGQDKKTERKAHN